MKLLQVLSQLYRNVLQRRHDLFIVRLVPEGPLHADTFAFSSLPGRNGIIGDAKMGFAAVSAR